MHIGESNCFFEEREGSVGARAARENGEIAPRGHVGGNADAGDSVINYESYKSEWNRGFLPPPLPCATAGGFLYKAWAIEENPSTT